MKETQFDEIKKEEKVHENTDANQNGQEREKSSITNRLDQDRFFRQVQGSVTAHDLHPISHCKLDPNPNYN